MDVAAVVLDNGSYVVRAGLAGDEVPGVVIPCVIGRDFLNKSYIGAAAADCECETLVYPVVRGVVSDWGDMRRVWHHVLRTIARHSTVGPVLLTEPAMTPVTERERSTEVMFEELSVPAFYLSNQSALALYASGRTEGCVVECGAQVTRSVPVYQGYALSASIQREDIGGYDVTDYLETSLADSTITRDIVRNIKEKLCYIAGNYDTELETAALELKKSYALPGGEVITIAELSFTSPEIIFNPALINKEHRGIHHICQDSINRTDMECRKVLLDNIVLSGSTALLPGFTQRMQSEVSSLFLSSWPGFAKVSAAEEHSAWAGGSILASLSSFEQMWITKEEYAEHGARIVRRKCY